MSEEDRKISESIRNALKVMGCNCEVEVDFAGPDHPCPTCLSEVPGHAWIVHHNRCRLQVAQVAQARKAAARFN